MITTILLTGAAMLLLMATHGQIKVNHHILEQPITIRTWSGTALAIWWAYISAITVGLFHTAYLAIVSKDKMLEMYATVSETQEMLNEIFKESLKTDKKVVEEEKDN